MRLAAVAAAGLWIAGCRLAPLPSGETPDATSSTPDATGEAMVWPDEDFRYEAPVPGPKPDVQIPEITTFTMEGGVDVYLVARDRIPTVSMSLSIPTGSVADPAGKRGLAGICSDLIEQGTQRLDKPGWEAAKADLASSVYSFASSETLGFGLSSLHRNFAATADLMFEMIESPGMRKRDLQRLRAQRKANLAQNKAAPGSLGRRLWRSVVYGPQHPYGALTTEAQYDAISVKDCEQHLARIGPRGANLFVAGATTQAEIRELFEARLAKLAVDRRGKPKAVPTLEVPPPAPRSGTIFFVDVPDAAQSQLYVGHPGPPRTADDYVATRLMAAVLGGGFSSRINMNIREDKGYAYGARARFGYRKHGGTFAASSSVRTDATVDALREIVGEIRRIREAPVEPEELDRERDGTLLGLPAQFSTAQRVRSTYSTLVFHGLPLDYYESFQAKVRQTKPADLAAAARKHLREDGFKVLVVGDGDEVRAGLKKLAADEGLFGGEGFVELDGDGNVIAGAS